MIIVENRMEGAAGVLVLRTQNPDDGAVLNALKPRPGETLSLTATDDGNWKFSRALTDAAKFAKYLATVPESERTE